MQRPLTDAAGFMSRGLLPHIVLRTSQVTFCHLEIAATPQAILFLLALLSQNTVGGRQNSKWASQRPQTRLPQDRRLRTGISVGQTSFDARGLQLPLLVFTRKLEEHSFARAGQTSKGPATLDAFLKR